LIAAAQQCLKLFPASSEFASPVFRGVSPCGLGWLWGAGLIPHVNTGAQPGLRLPSSQQQSALQGELHPYLIHPMVHIAELGRPECLASRSSCAFSNQWREIGVYKSNSILSSRQVRAGGGHRAGGFCGSTLCLQRASLCS